MTRLLSCLLAIALFGAVWAWQLRPIPVDRSWWREVPAAEWRAEHGDITVICTDGECWFEREGERVRL